MNAVMGTFSGPGKVRAEHTIMFTKTLWVSNIQIQTTTTKGHLQINGIRVINGYGKNC